MLVRCCRPILTHEKCGSIWRPAEILGSWLPLAPPGCTNAASHWRRAVSCRCHCQTAVSPPPVTVWERPAHPPHCSDELYRTNLLGRNYTEPFYECVWDFLLPLVAGHLARRVVQRDNKLRRTNPRRLHPGSGEAKCLKSEIIRPELTHPPNVGTYIVG